MVKEERFADTSRGKERHWTSGLSAKQREIALCDAWAAAFNLVKCLHGPLPRIVVKIAIAK